jgi:hypothetical protein
MKKSRKLEPEWATRLPEILFRQTNKAYIPFIYKETKIANNACGDSGILSCLQQASVNKALDDATIHK